MPYNSSLKQDEIVAEDGVEVTLSNTVDIFPDGSAVPILVCGVDGSPDNVNVSIVTKQGRTINFKNVPVATVLRIKAKRVLVTGTTSSCVCIALAAA